MKFILSDSSLNDYGFRLLTSGARLERFKANPVMLYMHDRYRLMPIGKWTNIAIEGDQLTAEPEFDDNDPVAQQVKQKVENGTLRAASVGFDVIATSSDPSMLIPGQTRSSVTEWEPYEASIVDIPGNRNALRMRNRQGLTLSGDRLPDDYIDIIVPKIGEMNKHEKIALALGLKAEATEAEITAAIEQLKLKKEGPQAPPADGEDAAAAAALQKQLNELKAEMATERATGLVDGAIAQGKVAKEQREAWMKLALANFDETKKALAAMSAPQSVAELLKKQRQSQSRANGEDRSKWTYEDYQKKDPNALLAMREDDPTRFSELARAHYGPEVSI